MSHILTRTRLACLVLVVLGPSACAQSTGTVVGWGVRGLPDVRSLENLVALAAGSTHTVALDGEGHLHAWGANEEGQCVLPESPGPFVAVAAGQVHS